MSFYEIKEINSSTKKSSHKNTSNIINSGIRIIYWGPCKEVWSFFSCFLFLGDNLSFEFFLSLIEFLQLSKFFCSKRCLFVKFEEIVGKVGFSLFYSNFWSNNWITLNNCTYLNFTRKSFYLCRLACYIFGIYVAF